MLQQTGYFHTDHVVLIAPLLADCDSVGRRIMQRLTMRPAATPSQAAASVWSLLLVVARPDAAALVWPPDCDSTRPAGTVSVTVSPSKIEPPANSNWVMRSGASSDEKVIDVMLCSRSVQTRVGEPVR